MLAALQYKPGERLVVEEVPQPEPGPGEVLIKMAYSPVNPSDLAMLRGTYAASPSYPVVPGIEGSGQVVKSGSGLMAGLRLNKKVACSATQGRGGTWAEYMVTSAMRTIPLGNHIDLDQGSMFIVNPMTALGIIKIARDEKHRAIATNAASGSLGKMLIRLSRKKNIKILCIVRKEEHIRELSDLGADVVLNSESSNFTENLRKLSSELGATFFLDAVGGEQTRILAEAMPFGGTLMLYAKLSEKDFIMDSRIVLQGNKTIKGFALANYTKNKSIFQVLNDIRTVKSLIGGELNSKINTVFDIHRVNDAIDTYSNSMSKGKVLVKLA